MLTPTETYTLKATFFETWHRTTQKLKRQELLCAKESLNLFYDSILKNRINKNVDISQFSPPEQFELMKNILLVQRQIAKFYGSFGESIFYKIQRQFHPLHEHFTEAQRYALAKIDSERRGIRVLERYQLPEELATRLINTARKQVQDYLPPLTEEWVIDCVRNGKRETLQSHIANRFAGNYGYVSSEATQALQQALRTLHIDTIPVFLDVLNRVKAEQEQYLLNNGCFQDPKLPCERPPHWGHHRDITGDTHVRFSHGGGFFYIIKFLTGKSAGYNLERPGTGIQVSPETHEHPRDKFYSEKAPQYFDYPARLSGTIQAKYLDSAVNGYEAGLRANFIDFIEDIVITRLDTGKVYRIGTVANQAAMPALDQKENDPTTQANPAAKSVCTMC